MRPLLAWLCAFVACGCTPFGSEPTVADGGAGGPEASAEAAVPDPGAPCLPAADFCDAFDDRTTVLGSWTRILSAGNKPLLDPADRSSPPNALNAIVPVGVADEYSGLQKDFAFEAKRVRLRFRVRFKSLVGVTYARFVSGTLGNRYFEVAVDSSKFSVHAGNEYRPVPKVVPTTDWMLVLFDVMFGNGGSMHLEINGLVVLDEPNLDLSDGMTGLATITLGPYVTPAAQTAVDVHYDDFSVELPH